MKRRGYVSTVLSVLFLALFLFPIYWMAVTSVKPQTEIFANPPGVRAVAYRLGRLGGAHL